MMMALTDSTDGVPLTRLFEGLADCSSCSRTRVSGLSLDSRRTRPGDLFLACHGTNTSGIYYIREAINAGAIAVAAEADAGTAILTNEVPVIPVNNLRNNAGIIAARFFDHPSAKMNVVGITGTNGKTSVSWFIAQCLSGDLKNNVGLIGTLGYGPYAQLTSGLNTTPDPVVLQQTLDEFYRKGIDTVIMEVTSIGLDQGRVAGVDFNIGLLTNLTIDHLDYHGDMHTYAEAKKQLFTSHALGHAIINIDDEYGGRLASDLSSEVDVTRYGLVDKFPAAACDDPGPNTVVAAVDETQDGLCLNIRSPWGWGELNVAISGRYNAYNLLASLAALCLLEISFDQALMQLSRITPVPGRLERFGGNNQPVVYVDYAHTPDALEHVLQYLKGTNSGKLLCVFGCGGNRDRTKRARMGAIAEVYADQVILTSDNPRHENPEAIIKEILDGFTRTESVQIQPDRTRAITTAVLSATAGDTILIAGKGHETYQEIAGQRIPFSDRQLVRNLLGTGA